MRGAARALSSATAANRPAPRARDAYSWYTSCETRWADNDVYGHLNNTVYYALIDSAVNRYLLARSALTLPVAAPASPATTSDAALGVVVSSGCVFFHSLAYPGAVDAGVRVARVGTSSVTFEVGLFGAGATTPAAQGHFTHVYVHAGSRRPVARLPAPLAAAVAALA
jgi:acyl-CoA thioester hydrolase